MTDILEVKAVLTVSDEGAITGIAWPFGSEDRVGDIIVKGAFAGAVAPVPMFWNHDPDQTIGVWDGIEETDEGLTVKGRLLVQDVARAREVRAMIQAKAATGLSIGFRTTTASPRTRGRTITALDLHEVSIVAVPCHPGAKITSSKSANPAPQTMKENTMDPEEIQTTPAPVTPANDAPGIDIKAFEAMQKRLDQLETRAARPQGVTITGPEKDTEERKAFMTFLRRGVERMPSDEVKNLTVADGANGGFLAPEEFGNELIKLLTEFSPIRSYARTINISAAEIIYPRRVAGTSATWVGETEDRTASQPSFEQLKLAPHELATFTDVSNALLEDNIYNLEGELLADFAESFGKTEGAAFVKGTGVGQPQGIMTATGVAEMKTGKADGFIDSGAPADVMVKMFHAIPTTHAQNAVWVMNRSTLGMIRTWKDAQGRYLVIDPIANGAPTTLLGRPVVEMVDMDDVAANKFPILFGDLSGFRIVDRIGLSTLRDPFSLATKGQVRFHARRRVGAGLTHPDRFIKLKVAV